MKTIFIYVILVVFKTPSCDGCDKCPVLFSGACCIAKPPSCCANKQGECPTNDFGSPDGPTPVVPFPGGIFTTCSGDQNCPRTQKCCPLRQASTGTIFYACQEPFTENSLGTARLASGCPSQFTVVNPVANQFDQFGNVNTG